MTLFVIKVHNVMIKNLLIKKELYLNHIFYEYMKYNLYCKKSNTSSAINMTTSQFIVRKILDTEYFQVFIIFQNDLNKKKKNTLCIIILICLEINNINIRKKNTKRYKSKTKHFITV